MIRHVPSFLCSILAAALLCVVLSACDDDEPAIRFELKVQKYSEDQLGLTWNPVKGADSYRIWRTSKISGATQGAVQVATVDWLTLEYTDTKLPLQSQLDYYVTTTVNGKEIKSNVVTEAGAQWFNFIPYQVKLFPERNLAIVRGYAEIVLVDYEQKIIVRKKTFSGKIGAIDIGTFNGEKELYVPSSDQNVYICDPYDLTVKATLVTKHPVESVAANTQGMIFLSNGDPKAPLKLYDRSTLSLINQYPGETNSGIMLQSDYKLLAVSTHISPATMSYYTFSPQGALLVKADDPYGWDYEMDAKRFRISDKYIVTATEGFIYTADEKMTLVTTLKNFGSNQSDFEFGADGSTVYAAITTQRSVLKATISNGQAAVSSISTTGYPWVMARNGDEMIVISSPQPFYLYSTTSKALIERILLK